MGGMDDADGFMRGVSPCDKTHSECHRKKLMETCRSGFTRSWRATSWNEAVTFADFSSASETYDLEIARRVSTCLSALTSCIEKGAEWSMSVPVSPSYKHVLRRNEISVFPEFGVRRKSCFANVDKQMSSRVRVFSSTTSGWRGARRNTLSSMYVDSITDSVLWKLVLTYSTSTFKRDKPLHPIPWYSSKKFARKRADLFQRLLMRDIENNATSNVILSRILFNVNDISVSLYRVTVGSRHPGSSVEICQHVDECFRRTR